MITGRAVALFVVLTAICPGSLYGSSPHGANARPYQTSDGGLPAVRRDTLLNGLQLIVLPQESSGTVKVHLRINTGSLFDLAGKGGLADMTARMIWKGAAGYSSKNVSDLVNQLQLAIKSTASWDSTDITISGPSSSFDTIIELLSRLLVSPTFPVADLDQAKAERLKEIIAEPRGDFFGVSQRATQTLFGTFPYGRPEAGTAYTVARITRDDLVYYHDRFYLANNAELAVSGDTTPEEVTRLARTKLGIWKKGEIIPATFRPPAPSESRQLFLIDAVDQGSAEAEIALIGISRRASDYFPTLVVAELLPGLIQDSPGVTVEASLNARTLPGPLVVRVKAPPDKMGAAIDRLIEGINQLRQGHVTAAQLQRAKESLISSYGQKLAGQDSFVDTLLDIELFGLGRDYIINYNNRIESVGASEVAQAAQSHLNPQTMVIVVSGPVSKVEPGMRKLGNVSVIKDQQSPQ